VTALPSISTICEPRTVPSLIQVERRVVPCSERVRADGKFLRRGNQRLRLHGVTYGPFAPNAHGEPFPNPSQVRTDCQRLHAAGFNALRVYHVPPQWLLQLADEMGLLLLVDIPWPKHVCFLDSPRVQEQTRRLVQQAAQAGHGHPSLLAYSIGNEIPANIVRWHGRRTVQRFLADLADTVHQADPQALVTYANYPPTEYLELPFLDLATFNVYLHERETFDRYLLRLHNLIGPQPLILGEVGLDSFRHGETMQATLLSTQVRDALLLGAAGVFVFAFTDDWHTGGAAVEDWAFGLTTTQRRAKPAYEAVSAVWRRPLVEQLPVTPRVSVVVCSYNGAATLEQCVQSLLRLDYPDYEVLVVDDGSTDNTPTLLTRYPEVRVIRQDNQGLSVARNVGLAAATGEIIAYTDADCFADADWLTHLVHHLQRCDAAGVGGPNLTPPDGPVAACVAASPGQPTHVLESDQVAEHVPGCNMAFRRSALLAIRGFDPAYRKAGDDVDLCWRLQQAGYWITFAPGAFVWHHRRQTPRTYLRQQAGYGEAEALLRFKHPDKFNERGHGKWRGSLYGASLRGVCLSDALIYRGTFGTGLFQCLYQPGPSHWAGLPCTLEWHAGVVLLALSGLLCPWASAMALVMWLLSCTVAGLQAYQASLPAGVSGWRYRALVALLCYGQPLVRSWSRYQTRLCSYRAPRAVGMLSDVTDRGLPWFGSLSWCYWSEASGSRLRLLNWVVGYLNEHRWGRALDNGWSDWDVRIYGHPWTLVEVLTAEESHGCGRELVRVRYRLKASGYLRVSAVVSLLGLVGSLYGDSWWLLGLSLALCTVCMGMWWSGRRRALAVLALWERGAAALGMKRLAPSAAGDRQPRP
jgi:O-antigen biosynthesis protein